MKCKLYNVSLESTSKETFLFYKPTIELEETEKNTVLDEVIYIVTVLIRRRKKYGKQCLHNTEELCSYVAKYVHYEHVQSIYIFKECSLLLCTSVRNSLGNSLI